MKKLILVFLVLSLSLVAVACSFHETSEKIEVQVLAKSKDQKSIDAGLPKLQKVKSFYDYTKALDLNDLAEENIKTDLAINIADPKTLYDFSSLVFVARVESIDGVSMKFGEERSSMPITLGKLNILKVLKGSLDLGKEVEFARLGGIISTKEYYKGADPFKIEKANYLRSKTKRVKVSEDESYRSIKHEGDFYLEAGSTYLFYANNYDGFADRLVIEGFAHGALELEEESSNKFVLAKDKQGMSLEEFIAKYFS